MSSRFGLALVVVALAVSGCGGSKATVGSAQEAFDRGQEAFANRKFDRAAEHFKTVLDFGRTGELADDAQLFLARSYAGDKQHLLAGAEFTRFIEFYRGDPRIEAAAYERIQSYAALSPRYELDQTDTKRALDYIRLYLQQYPESQHGAEASSIAAGLREKLAQKQYEAARLYERREQFEAAVMMYEGVLTEYPSSEFADDALLGALRAQVLYAQNSVAARQVARYRAAVQVYDRMLSLFPSSPLVREAEAEYDRANRALQDLGALGVPTAAGN